MAIGTSGETALTPEAIAEVRSRMGDVHPAKPWWNTATDDAIRHFANGYGDTNPLFTDPEYAAKTSYGALVAPPPFFYAFIAAGGSTGGVGLPGAFTLHAQDEWEWFRPILAGTTVHGTQRLVGIDEKDSKWAGRTIHQTLQTDFFDQNNEHVAAYRMLVVRGDRKEARASKKYDSKELPETHYTDQQLDEIAAAYDSESIRGAETRYYEDVSVGDDVGQLVKGPLGIHDMIAWWMGRGAPLIKAFKVWHDYMKLRPGIAIIDPETNIRNTPEAAHYDAKLARRSGLAAPYDIGHWRTTWVSHLLTNWCGDDGRVSKVRARILRPNYVGDTAWVRGKVIEKKPETNSIVIEVTIHNQHGDLLTTGQGEVILPSRVVN